MNATALAELSSVGVAIWLDDLSRDLITTGELQRLIDQRYVVGVTSNPTIFAKALSSSHSYDSALRDLATRKVDVNDAVRTITTDDVRSACDVFEPVFAASSTQDGRVSIEVSPELAHDSEGTLEEARRLWKIIDRKNLFVKIPATQEGLRAITAATAEGISVNVTLIFSLDRYRAVMNAYQTGLEQAHQAGRDLSTIASVASFFISRIDSAIDQELKALGSTEAEQLLGKSAIANGHLAYEAYTEVFNTPRWQVLADAGAQPQRPLWASTGVKNPDYKDTMYVEELIVNGCVNTMPDATLEAFADHGEVRGDTVTGRGKDAEKVLDSIERLGISYTKITERLEEEGVSKFAASWSELLETVKDGLARFAS